MSLNIELKNTFFSKLNTQNAVELCENFVKTLEATPGAIYTHFSDEIAHHVVYIIMDDFEVLPRFLFIKFWYYIDIFFTGVQTNRSI